MPVEQSILFVNVIGRHKCGFLFGLVLIEPPAPFVFLSAVPSVVVIVLVIGAEFHALVTGPFDLRNLIASSQSISSGTNVVSKGKAVVLLLTEVKNNNLHEVKGRVQDVFFFFLNE